MAEVPFNFHVKNILEKASESLFDAHRIALLNITPYKMKYIITDQNEVVIGPGYHITLAKEAKGNVIRAGHVRFQDGLAIVSGESIGFGIRSQPEDADIIDKKEDIIYA